MKKIIFIATIGICFIAVLGVHLRTEIIIIAVVLLMMCVTTFLLRRNTNNGRKIHQHYPAKIIQGRKLIKEYCCHIAGVTYRLENTIHFAEGSEQKIKIKPDPMPKYPDAISVWGEWKNNGGSLKSGQLGYVPKDDAIKISKLLKKHKGAILAGKLFQIFLPTAKKSPGFRMNVGIFQ